MKTSELTGAALDWAVARCKFPDAATQDIEVWVQPLACDDSDEFKFQPSTDWAQGGPIIEREGITISRAYGGDYWWAVHDKNELEVLGPTPLVAAMRAYVTFYLGDEIDVPDELIKDK